MGPFSFTMDERNNKGGRIGYPVTKDGVMFLRGEGQEFGVPVVGCNSSIILKNKHAVNGTDHIMHISNIDPPRMPRMRIKETGHSLSINKNAGQENP